MTETKRRIEEYKSRLPKMKEKVAAAIALLLIGAAMMTTVSFAWLAISVNPEVSGVNTAIASNGNLEIALATGSRYTSTAPGATQLGDSNKENVDRNITWGNLINLSDPIYGLENLVLRPAQLNTAKLNTSPLYGALYSSDGRLEKLNSSFGYAKWTPGEDGEDGMFVYNTELGVNAISSITKYFGEEQKKYDNFITSADEKNLEAATDYKAIANNSAWMGSLATMMGTFMTGEMSTEDPTVNQADVQNLRDMYAEFKRIMEIEAEAIAISLNFQLYVTVGADYTPYTAEDVLNLLTDKKGGAFTSETVEGVRRDSYTRVVQRSTNENATIKIIALKTFLDDYNKVCSDYEKLVTLADQGSFKWSSEGGKTLNDIVNNLVTISSCTIGSDNTTISSLMSNPTSAMGYLSGEHEARITNGILYNFEERTGGYLRVEGLKLSAKATLKGITMPATITANIQTSAPRNYNLFTKDIAYGESLFMGEFEGGRLVANDTYGLAIDLWIRTNAAGGFLTLEGNVVLSDPEYVDVTGLDANGNTVQYYTLNRTIQEEGSSETTTVEYTLYNIVTEVTNEESGETEEVTTWYDAYTHATITLEDGENPTKKIKEVRYVIGYDGVNRVWEGEPLAGNLSVSSTTQGSGSCYVFYPANSEDQARTLELLKSMKVAFVDASGNLLAMAKMDTDMRYEQPGRVIVPLVLDPANSVSLGEDLQGNEIRGITALEKNVATRITAIVYLDGLDVGNEDVLSAANIQGHLNVQFGTTASLNNAENEELELKEINVSAAIDKTEFSIDDEEAMTTNVELTITGDQPSSVTAYFYRELNSTQGARERMMTFTDPDGDGVWTASYTFTSPGKYVLRSVQIDGSERELSNAEHPRVTVEGFTIKSLTLSSELRVLTAASSHTAPMTIEFASHDVTKMPQTVEARFRREDGTVAAAVFNYNPTTGKWTADVKFTFSGTYDLTSIYLDGIETPLPEGMDKSITLYLGMYVNVYTASPNSFKYVPDEMADNEKNLAMQVKIYDNSGNEMPALAGVQLNYAQSGSGTKKMNADVVWNAATGYYEGTFSSLDCIGIFKFSNVKVGANVITSATTSPTFTILSPNPPELISNTLKVAANGISFEAEMKYTEAATVVGYIVDKDGNTHEVQGTGVHHLATETREAYSTWTFNIPADNNGNRDGRWEFVGIKVWNYYDANGVEQSAPLDANGNIIKDAERGTPAEFNVTLGPIKIAKVPIVSIATDKSTNFGKDSSGKVIGTFMQSYSGDNGLNGLSVTIKDFENMALVDANGNFAVTDVQFIFKYKLGTSQNYGGYKMTTGSTEGADTLYDTTAGATITVNLTTTDGINFTQTEAATFLYAGDYTTTFSFKVNGTSYTYTYDTKADLANMPKVTVSSVAPTVSIKSIAPTGTFSVDTIESGQLEDTTGSESSGSGFRTQMRYWNQTDEKHLFATNNKTHIPEYSATSAKVYFKCTHPDQSKYGTTGWYNFSIAWTAYLNGNKWYYHEYEQPTVTITLAGIGNASNATLAFADSSGTAAHIYSSKGGTTKADYTWTANGDKMMYIGLYGDSDGDDDTKTVAGTVTATQIVLTDAKGNTYVVDLGDKDITINNEY